MSPARVLHRALLPAGLLSRGPATLTPGEYYRFWEALDVEGPDRDLAVGIGRCISVEVFNPPIFAALCSPDLATAAHRIATYKPLIGPMRLEVNCGAQGLTIKCHWPAGLTPPRLLAMAELVFWAALARIATRHHVRPVQVSVLEPPADPAALEGFFGACVSSGTAHTIVFEPSDARRPFLTENEQMWRFFAPELSKRLSDLQASDSVADRVRAALHMALPAGGSIMTAVTRHLAVSSRTLQRKLHIEGTTFQEILASTREDLARHYLTHSALRTPEIAYLLGYDDSNSFYRAFRSWTGKTPDAFRATATGYARKAAHG